MEILLVRLLKHCYCPRISLLADRKEKRMEGR